jgi:hypothetical protein
MLGGGDAFAFDILRADAVRRETNIGHKLTKIVSGFLRAATNP